MSRAKVVLLPGLVLLQFCAGVVFADALDQDSALAWLERIAKAARQLNYSGTFVYQRGGQFETSRITHYFDRTGEYEKLETLDGPRREIIRTDQEILTFDPDNRVVKWEKRTPHKTFPALLPDQLSSLTEYYRLRKGDSERVAGYDAQALELEPADAYRYGHKLWAEVRTGLLLKARMLDGSNRTIEQFKFTQLAIGPGITRDSVRPSFDRYSREFRREAVGPESATPAETGWAVHSPPAGFKKVMEMNRVKSGTRSPVAHLVYSDGLAAISVFVEPSPPRQRTYQAGLTRQGAVHIYTRVLADEIVTVLGEAPALTVKQMAESVGKVH